MKYKGKFQVVEESNYNSSNLQKIYNLIDPFSEDIDLSMDRRPTQSERVKSKELIIEIAENLGLVLSNPEEIKSRYDYAIENGIAIIAESDVFLYCKNFVILLIKFLYLHIIILQTHAKQLHIAY